LNSTSDSNQSNQQFQLSSEMGETTAFAWGYPEERTKKMAGDYDVSHFATHAQLDENEPQSSALLLAGDGSEDGRLNRPIHK